MRGFIGPLRHTVPPERLQGPTRQATLPRGPRLSRATSRAGTNTARTPTPLRRMLHASRRLAGRSDLAGRRDVGGHCQWRPADSTPVPHLRRRSPRAHRCRQQRHNSRHGARRRAEPAAAGGPRRPRRRHRGSDEAKSRSFRPRGDAGEPSGLPSAACRGRARHHHCSGHYGRRGDRRAARRRRRSVGGRPPRPRNCAVHRWVVLGSLTVGSGALDCSGGARASRHGGGRAVGFAGRFPDYPGHRGLGP